SQVTTWLLAIARNKALSALQRQSTEQLDEEAVAAIEDTDNNPEVTVHTRQRSAILLNCLTQLSPHHREVIDLVYYHEKSTDEVAEIIGVPQNTVKTRMFYARKRRSTKPRHQSSWPVCDAVHTPLFVRFASPRSVDLSYIPCLATIPPITTKSLSRSSRVASGICEYGKGQEHERLAA